MHHVLDATSGAGALHQLVKVDETVCSRAEDHRIAGKVPDLVHERRSLLVAFFVELHVEPGDHLLELLVQLYGPLVAAGFLVAVAVVPMEQRQAGLDLVEVVEDLHDFGLLLRPGGVEVLLVDRLLLLADALLAVGDHLSDLLLLHGSLPFG